MLLHWLNLVRWKNLLIVAVTLLFFRYLVYRPIILSAHEIDEVSYGVEGIDYFLFVIGMLILTATGNIINDVYDIAVDKINRSDDRVVEKHLSIRAVIVLYWSLLTLGAAINIYLVTVYEAFQWIWIYPITALLLYLYAWKLQRLALIGNILVSILSASVIYMAFLVEHPSFTASLQSLEPYAVVLTASALTSFYAIFGFLSSMARELIKDKEDILGDKMNGYKTFAIVAGDSATRQLASFFLVALVAFMYYAISSMPEIKGPQIYAASFILVAGPSLVMIYMIQAAENKLAFGQVAMFLKWLMLGGLVLLPVITMNL